MTTDEQIFLLRRAKDLLQQAQALDLADVLQGVVQGLDRDCHLSVICNA